MLQPAAGRAAAARGGVGGDGLPLSQLHRGAPGSLPAARRRDLWRDSAGTGLRLLPGVCPSGGRVLRRVHAEMRQRLPLLPPARLRLASGAAGERAGAVRTQSRHRGAHCGASAAER